MNKAAELRAKIEGLRTPTNFPTAQLWKSVMIELLALVAPETGETEGQEPAVDQPVIDATAGTPVVDSSVETEVAAAAEVDAKPAGESEDFFAAE
ncbi:MAG: hypothetical protein ABJZ55_20400 [Fuerstiella sp.]